MLNRLGLNQQSPLHIAWAFVLLLIIIGLPLSRFLVSASTILLVIFSIALWIKEFSWPNQKTLKRSGIFIGLFVIHVVWLLLPGDNYKHALADLQIKLPLLVFPVLFVMGPSLSRKFWNVFLLVFLSACTISSWVSLYLAFSDFMGWRDLDFRQYSPFFSHIRLSLNLVLCVCILVFKWEDIKQLLPYKAILFIVLFSLLLCLIVLQSVTGLGILLLLAIVFAHKFKQKWVGLSVLALMLVLLGYMSFLWLDYKAQTPAPPEGLWNKTTENGVYVYADVDESTTAWAWEERSNIKWDSTNQKGFVLKAAVLRYLSSKHLPKNREGVMQLTQEDISRIEKGQTNVNQHKWNPIKSRFKALIFQYENLMSGGNPSGNSVAVRSVYWEIAGMLISEKPWLGRGMQGLKSGFAEAYESVYPQIDVEFRKRAHNQWITFLICFGVIGFVLCIAALFIPLWKRKLPMLSWAYLFILFCSFLSEDTLETQMGATFAGFWYALFVLGQLSDDRDSSARR